MAAHKELDDTKSLKLANSQTSEISDASDWTLISPPPSTNRLKPYHPAATDANNSFVPTCKHKRGLRCERAYSNLKASDVIPLRPAPEDGIPPGQTRELMENLVEFDDACNAIVHHG